MAVHDPYAVLGLSKGASQSEIRKAYRKLAKRYHPDVNQGNAEVAKRFAEIGEAYELIGTPEARKTFEQQEAAARHFRQHGGPRGYTRGGQGVDANFGDIFSQFFSNMGSTTQQQQPPEQEYSLHIGFEEAILGTTRRVTLQDNRTVNLNIPAGIETGTRLRLPGSASGRGQSATAYITITVRDSDRYTRNGDNLEMKLPLAIHEAVLGAQVSLETPFGTFSLRIPPGTTSGKKLRLRGKGVHPAKKEKAGDLIVETVLMLPEQVDDELRAFCESWGASHGYNPR